MIYNILVSAKINRMPVTSHDIKEKAYELGFVLCGIAPSNVVSAEVAIGFSNYIADGRHAGMDYLARNIDKRFDVELLVEGAKSVICCAVSYNNPEPEGDGSGFYVARYARFRDYHDSIKDRLKVLGKWISDNSEVKPRMRCFVDTAPILEKYYAVEAGLGWIGNNNLLINPEYGSQLLLGEIVIDIELDYDSKMARDCGGCRMCLESCPMGAVSGEWSFDSNKCLSYHTIESKEPLPQDIVKQLGNKLFGCDDCQKACPYNRKAKHNVDPEFMFRFHGIGKEELLSMTEQEFAERFAATPLERAGLKRLKYIAGIIAECEMD